MDRQNYIGFTYKCPIAYLYLFTVKWCLHGDKGLPEKKKYYQVWQEVSNDGSSDRTHDFPRGK